MQYSSSYTQNYDEDLSPSHVYMDINIVNNDTTGTMADPAIQFTETRSSSILLNPSRYFLSVVRFQLETPDLPLFIPSVIIGQTDINKTIYSVTLSFIYNGNNYEVQQYVQFVPEFVNENLPETPLKAQDMRNRYYWISTYQHFINCINKAYVDAFNALNTLVVNAGGVLPTANAPFVAYDNNSGIFSLYVDQVGYDGAGIQIYGNSAYYKLIGAMDTLNYGNSPGIINGKNFKYLCYGTNGLNSVTLNGVNYYKMDQNYCTTPLWCPVKAIVFSCSGLPILPEQIATPVIYNSSTSFNVGANSNISLQMTDFVVGLLKGTEFEPNILYSPTVYRLIDMFGNQPLQTFGINVFWQDTFGNQYPLKLFSGTSCQIKLMFRLKSLGI